MLKQLIFVDYRKIQRLPGLYVLWVDCMGNIGKIFILLLKKPIYGIEQKVTIDWNVDNNRLEQ